MPLDCQEVGREIHGLLPVISVWVELAPTLATVRQRAHDLHFQRLCIAIPGALSLTQPHVPHTRLRGRFFHLLLVSVNSSSSDELANVLVAPQCRHTPFTVGPFGVSMR